MSSPVETSAWFPNVRFRPEARLRLFCFPYAGGGGHIYRNWQAGLPPDIEVCPVQLPGRGSRLGEPGFRNMPALTEALARVVGPRLDRPFALFGHSMGGIIAFELTRALRPAHLFVSGCSAPHIPDEEAPTFDLPEAEFIEKLRSINGTPAEVFDHPELLQMMLPLLRADFELVETYAYVPGEPLACPITAIGGLKDEDVTREKLEAWREHSTAAFSLRMLPGGHFFVNTEQASIHRMLAQGLSPHIT
jgi:medium-chain acyl-[acyl-carrier-protein] hydrolase